MGAVSDHSHLAVQEQKKDCMVEKGRRSPFGDAMRTNLNVPYEEKDEAKKCGARWDPLLRLWYVQQSNLIPFLRWLPPEVRQRWRSHPLAAPSGRMITSELLAAAVTKEQFAALGVPFPPPKGWKSKLIGRKISEQDLQAFWELL